MITRNELAAFIRKVADAKHTQGEWDSIAVNHYHDEPMETARCEVVKQCLGYGSNEDKRFSLRERLLRIASELENG